VGFLRAISCRNSVHGASSSQFPAFKDLRMKRIILYPNCSGRLPD
jgi:hypothetical protein